MSENKKKDKKQSYQKAELKSFSLVAEEVLAGTGCKGVGGGGATATGGASCQFAGCLGLGS